MVSIKAIIQSILFGKPATGEKVNYSRGQKVYTTYPDGGLLPFNEWAERIRNLVRER